MSATLQTTSITVVNLQDNRAVFRIFIALLRFSFDSSSYVQTARNNEANIRFSLFRECANLDANLNMAEFQCLYMQGIVHWREY